MATFYPDERIVYRDATARDWLNEHMPGEL
jgi:hypothetical protein